jgi:hypothetical protein
MNKENNITTFFVILIFIILICHSIGFYIINKRLDNIDTYVFLNLKENIISAAAILNKITPDYSLDYQFLKFVVHTNENISFSCINLESNDSIRVVAIISFINDDILENNTHFTIRLPDCKILKKEDTFATISGKKVLFETKVAVMRE